jgi:tRNA modification GTPase
MMSDHTIIALSTPQGTGAIAVIRLSGKDAIKIISSVFKGKDLTVQATHTLHFGKINDGNETLDEVVVALFKAPHSYTKEDVVEISCHGSSYIVQKIIELLIRHGVKPAKAGEFTLRAFLNGRFDLSQAEAVADLIAAESEISHHAAINQMRGGFSSEIKQLREQLIHFASLVELELDFAEEDVEFANREQLKQLISNLITHITHLIDSFRLGNVIKNGVTTVIAGRPNAGKSTLLNALLNEERAIVSEIPGTTRDAIEEIIHINGITFRLIDTAGIREATDVIEKIGVEKTMEKIRQSAIVLYLFDVNTLKPDELKKDLSVLSHHNLSLIAVGNKIDNAKSHKPETEFSSFKNILFISAKEKIHLDELKKYLSDSIIQNDKLGDKNIVTNVRHYEALLRADAALNEALLSLNKKISGELMALDIRRALDALGEITGSITTNDLLETIFSKFCIGK